MEHERQLMNADPTANAQTSPPPPPPPSTRPSLAYVVVYVLLTAILSAAYFRNDAYLVTRGESARAWRHKSRRQQNAKKATAVKYTIVGPNDDDDLVGVKNGCGASNSTAFFDRFGVEVPRTCIDLSPVHNLTQRRRCFYTYVPASCEGEKSPVPVVFDIHGAGSCAFDLSKYSHWKETADEECFVVIWPEGTMDKALAAYSCWSFPGGRIYRYINETEDDEDGEEIIGRTPDPCCCVAGTSGYSDESAPDQNPWDVPIADSIVLRFMIEVVLHQFNDDSQANALRIDSSRVYMAGHSNGCIAALSMGALHSDVVAAVACHSGEVITAYDLDGSIYGANRMDRSVPYIPTPTWIVHGTGDKVLTYGGGTSMFMRNVIMPSMETTFHYIANSNGCSPEVVVNELLENRTWMLRRTNCTNNADVVFLSVTAGHRTYTPDGLVTTAMAWKFCSSYSLDSKNG